MSSSSSALPQKKYDLFVSYRGPDVKRSFVSHLRDRLEGEGFTLFYDDDPDDAGKRIDAKIFSAIRQARVALIVLSTNYAGSKWCLNELVEILKCNSEPKNLVVIPVFYEVDPADVKNWRSKSEFMLSFESLCKEKDNGEWRKTWEEALRKVKNFSGFESKKFRKDPDLLDTIVQSLCEKICPSKSLDFAKTAIGADRLADDVIHLLKIDKDNVCMIGISGTKKIGKTMVARAVCKGTLKEFERFIFLDKVGEADNFNFVGLQKKLLRNLLEMNEQMPEDSFHGYIERIKRNLHRKKILLVLDGVAKREQIKNLGVELRKCRQGSRILITTEDPDLLKDLQVDDTYNVAGLNRDEAFRLFCRHAFGREEPEEGCEELSRYLAHYAGGHPSALEQWGSTLNKRSRDEWQQFSGALMNDPEYINSIIENFWQNFPGYPCKVGGPRGGNPETKTWKDEGYQGVKKIVGGVDSEGIKFITVQYEKNGRSTKPVIHGTEGGRAHTIELDYPSEYLIYMSGHTKEDSGRTILQWLTFHTNRGKRASIGTDEEGRKFSFPFPYTGHKIVGFQGSCDGSHLESIEAMYKPVPHTPMGDAGRVFGPFGGAGEISWATDNINGIFVRCEDFINEINFKVCTTSSKPQTTYNANGVQHTFQVKLETPDECITSFSGYFENACGRILIKSLTFRTNKRILGPIGREEGKYFSSPSPSEAEKVTRFFGRTTDYLESIGAQVTSCDPLKSPWLFGCPDAPGAEWDDGGDHIKVRKIIVEPENEIFIRLITFHYEVNNRPLQLRGHPDIPANCAEPPTFQIDADEYLTSMSGYYTENGITSLMFGTNKRALELIGHKEGIHFSSPAGGKIVGFYGKSDENLKVIGAYFEQIPHPYPMTLIGSFRGSSGETCEDVNIKGVRQIKIEHVNKIHSIKFEYKDGSAPSYLVKGGCPRGNNLNVTTVTLDYPREYLTSISGYAENDAIKSLTFYSNKGSSSLCGDPSSEYFGYPSNGSRITSFYVKKDPDNRTLKSIGVYLEPIPRMYPFKTVEPFRSSGGTPWDDGVYTDVRGFRISFGEAIEAIGIAYDNNGSFVSGPEHGHGYENWGSFVLGFKPGHRYVKNYEEVILDYPKERLSLIWVWVDEDGNTDQIQDLKIITKDEGPTYGPFVSTESFLRQTWTTRCIPSEEDGDRRIVGFFGREGRYLNAIGARLEPY